MLVHKKTQTDSPTNIVLVIQSRRGLGWGWWTWHWDCSNKPQTNCILCLLCFYKNLLLKHHQCSRHEFTRTRITTPATARRTSFIYKADEWAEGGVWGVQDAIQRNAAVNESKSYCHCDCVFYSAILKWWRKKNWRRRRRKRKLNDSSRILQWLIIIWALCQCRRKAEGGGQARDRLALALPLHATHRSSSSSDHCVGMSWRWSPGCDKLTNIILLVYFYYYLSSSLPARDTRENNIIIVVILQWQSNGGWLEKSSANYNVFTLFIATESYLSNNNHTTHETQRFPPIVC